MLIFFISKSASSLEVSGNRKRALTSDKSVGLADLGIREISPSYIREIRN